MSKTASTLLTLVCLTSAGCGDRCADKGRKLGVEMVDVGSVDWTQCWVKQGGVWRPWNEATYIKPEKPEGQ